MDYQILYSKRRTLCLQVKRDKTIVVKAPYRVSKDKIESFVLSHLDWIEKTLKRVEERPTIEKLNNKEIKELKQKTYEIIAPFVEYYSLKMGVTPSKVSISTAKTRFGSCSSKKSLNFSCRLALYPIEAIEYVCVHELAHLIEMNHSKKFWQIVEKHLPDLLFWTIKLWERIWIFPQ